LRDTLYMNLLLFKLNISHLSYKFDFRYSRKPLGNRLVFWNDLNLKILFVHFVVNAGYSNLNICMIIAVTGTVGTKRFKIICAKFY